MGYVAVKGGAAAIEQSINRLRYERLKGRSISEVQVIKDTMRGLIDQIMSEGSLYSRDLAALAIKQAEGNGEEATFLLRAYRSTLPRKYYSQIVDSREMRVERRISSAFKDIPGGQILGASYDYTHRLLDFGLLAERPEDIEKWLREFEDNIGDNQIGEGKSFPKVVDFLRLEGLIPPVSDDDQEPQDITRKSLDFPTTRSERLQTLTRGQTGAVTALGYAAIRGYGAVHPTVGELRVGYLPITIPYPLTASEDEDSSTEDNSIYLGEVQVTEVEALVPVTSKSPAGQKELQFSIGYGICYGQNETKAIAMSILDTCLEKRQPGSPVHDEEFVLMHIDCVEATGFISHLKLPHYVTFQSKLDSVRKTRAKDEEV